MKVAMSYYLWYPRYPHFVTEFLLVRLVELLVVVSHIDRVVVGGVLINECLLVKAIIALTLIPLDQLGSGYRSSGASCCSNCWNLTTANADDVVVLIHVDDLLRLLLA